MFLLKPEQTNKFGLIFVYINLKKLNVISFFKDLSFTSNDKK